MKKIFLFVQAKLKARREHVERSLQMQYDERISYTIVTGKHLDEAKNIDRIIRYASGSAIYN